MKRKVAFFLILTLALTGCGKKPVVEEEEDDEDVPVVVKEADWNAVLDGKEEFIGLDEKAYNITTLPDSDKYYFTLADVDGDEEVELCVKTLNTLYVINYKDRDYKVIYEGSVYEDPVDAPEKHGIYKYIKGSAPESEQFKFTEIDDEGNIVSEAFASRYDANDNGIFDEADMYYVDADDSTPVDEPTWKSKAGGIYNYVENYAPFTHPVKWLENNGIRDVTWNNSYEPSGEGYSDNTVITFTFDNGSSQDIDTGHAFGVQKLDLADIDNDGADEFIIYGALGSESYNVAAFIYKLVDGSITQIDYKSSIDGIRDSAVYTANYDSVYYYGNVYNALAVTSPSEPTVYNFYDNYGSTIYFADGQWHEFLGHYVPVIKEYTCDECGEVMCRSYEEVFVLNEGYSEYTEQINQLILEDLTIDGLPYIYNDYSAPCGSHSTEYTEYYCMISDYSLVDSTRYLKIDVSYMTQLASAPAPWRDQESFYYDLQTGERITEEDIHNV